MSRPWMPLYIADYLADTGHLSAAEHGAYLLLIMHYWQTGGLPDDECRLARIARMNDLEWAAARGQLIEFFGLGWSHERIDGELAESERLSKQGKLGGIASGDVRRKRQSRPKSTTSTDSTEPNSGEARSQTPTEREANSQRNAKPTPPITRSQTPTEREAPQPHPQKIDDAVDARAREPLVSELAWAIASDLAVIAGHQHDPPDWPPSWAGSPMRVQTWLNEGWEQENIISGAKRCAGRFTGVIHSVQFFETTIAEERARQARGLPVVTVADQKIITVNGAKNGNCREDRSVGNAAGRLAEQGITFGPRPNILAPKEGADVVSLLAKGRGGQS